MNENYFTNLKYWQKLTGEKPENMSVIYGGDTNFKNLKWKLYFLEKVN